MSKEDMMNKISFALKGPNFKEPDAGWEAMNGDGE